MGKLEQDQNNKNIKEKEFKTDIRELKSSKMARKVSLDQLMEFQCNNSLNNNILPKAQKSNISHKELLFFIAFVIAFIIQLASEIISIIFSYANQKFKEEILLFCIIIKTLTMIILFLMILYIKRKKKKNIQLPKIQKLSTLNYENIKTKNVISNDGKIFDHKNTKKVSANKQSTKQSILKNGSSMETVKKLKKLNSLAQSDDISPIKHRRVVMLASTGCIAFNFVQTCFYATYSLTILQISFGLVMLSLLLSYLSSFSVLIFGLVHICGLWEACKGQSQVADSTIKKGSSSKTRQFSTSVKSNNKINNQKKKFKKKFYQEKFQLQPSKYRNKIPQRKMIANCLMNQKVKMRQKIQQILISLKMSSKISSQTEHQKLLEEQKQEQKLNILSTNIRKSQKEEKTQQKKKKSQLIKISLQEQMKAMKRKLAKFRSNRNVF